MLMQQKVKCRKQQRGRRSVKAWSCRDLSFGEFGIKRGADENSLAREAVKAHSAVGPEIPDLSAQKHAGVDLRRRGGGKHEAGLMLPDAGVVGAHRFKSVDEIEGREQARRDQFLVDCQNEIASIAVGGRAADVIDRAETRIDAERKPDRCLRAVEHAVAQLERYRLECPTIAIFEVGHACNVVVGNTDARLYPPVLKGNEFQPEGN